MKQLSLFKVKYSLTNYFGDELNYEEFVVAENEELVRLSYSSKEISCELIQENITVLKNFQ